MNSLRLGLVHEDAIYGKPTIFVAMGSQSLDAKSHDNNGSEPGDDYEIMAHDENILGIEFYVTEKIDATHKFFKDFGVPTNDFTAYHFDDKTKFVKKV